MKPISLPWAYWVRPFLATMFSLLVAFAATIAWISYRQTLDYLHPARQTPSGAVLHASGIEFQEVELITEDHVRLSTWYTPPKPALSAVEGNGAVILVAHGYGDKRAEDFHALFASHGYGVIAWAPCR